MFNQNSGYSLADIAAATGNGGGNGMWGEGCSWWIIILFLFCFAGGWGNGGYGFGGGNGGVTEGYVLASDFANIERKIDTVNGGLCDGFYAMNTGMLNGFSGVNTAIQNATISEMQNNFALSTQLNGLAASQAQCCCDLGNKVTSGFAELNYNLATQECATRQAISDTTRDIIDNNNANTRSILDFLVKDKIDALTSENQSLRLAASQQAQNAYLIDQLGMKVPQAAYIVSNPYTGTYGRYGGCGASYGCSCNA